MLSRSFAALLLALTGWTQQLPPSASLTGTVSDRAGVPVAAAIVELRNTTSATTSRGRTDASGRYAFDAIAPGTYSVKVDADEFALSTVSGLRFLAGTNTSLDITLDRDAMRAPSATPRVKALPVDAANPLPTFLVTCTNLTTAAISADSVRTGIKLDGMELPEPSTVWLGGSPPSPVSAGRWWRLVIELAPKSGGPTTFHSPNLGEPAIKIRRPVDLTAGSHRVAFSCGGAWSEEVSFSWRRQKLP